MKKLFAIVLLMAVAMPTNAQDVYSVGYYDETNGTIAALYKNGNRLYTAQYSSQTSKATRVTCNSQGDAFWLVNFYDYPDGTYNHTEIRLNDHVYASTENHREVHIADMYCLKDTIYYAGYQYNEDSVLMATVWKGSNFETHWVMGDGVHPSSIAFSDIDKRTGIPYFCGYIIDDKKRAAIWKAQELLSTFEQDSIYEAPITSSYASQIAVENGHVYTIGEFEQQGFPIPALWKDNVLVRYVQPYFDVLHCICAFDDSYYYGYTSRWQYYDAILKDYNSEVLQLEYAYCIQSTFTDIYVLGKDFDNKFYVWKNFEKQCQIENCNALYDMCVFDPFFEPHSEWYYEILNDDGSTTYQHLECTADTTIGNERPKIIVRTNTIYDRDEIITETTHEYVYERNGKMYWWNKDLEEYTTLYDLTAEAGDEWEIKVGTESILVHVDSVGVFEYDGDTRKMLHISDAGSLFSGDIVVGYGHLTSFFPEKLMNRGKGYRVEGLRCYWIGDELVYHDGDEDCDAIYAELHNGINEDGPSTGSGTFTVYPNPANGVLFVETRLIASLPDQTYRIINLMGQTLLQGHISAETQQIDISTLPAGMYFISVGGQTVKFVVK